MNRLVQSIAGRMSLRAPQRDSLEILDRVTEIARPRKDVNVAETLSLIAKEYPTVTDFEREFPSLCFALATGVGKTRLMGAFISYLYLSHGIRNFFVLAPNLTIYNKLITDFTPNTPKYVFKGIAEFATEAPEIITGENYEAGAGTRFEHLDLCKVNIFNISKINSEVRGGKSPRIKRLSEFIGASYFDYLARQKDLVLIMDESHRYRASAGARAINELKPILGLELTATPFVESAKGPVWFRNIIYSYSLAKAMEHGFVKEPAVVTRKDFDPSGMSPDEIERIKLEDGVRLHAKVKVQLETYARNYEQPFVKPFLLVIARDTTHAGQLLKLIQSEEFFGGQFKEKVIQVDSSKTGAEEEEMITRLLKVEHTDEPTEIVIHVNMLKEGWDVTNLYTIVPLRAANARTLVEQSIGRGLRLPYGKRTGVTDVDRLNIVAHDRFQEIVDDSRKPDSPIRLQAVLLDPTELASKAVTVVVQSNLDNALQVTPASLSSTTVVATDSKPPLFSDPEEASVAKITKTVIEEFRHQPNSVPHLEYLTKPEIQKQIRDKVQEIYRPAQLELGVAPQVDIASIVTKTTEEVVRQTIPIPRVLVVPRGEVKSGFRPFKLELSNLRLQAPSEDLYIQYLRTTEQEIMAIGGSETEERRLEDYVVRGLMDFDDVAYDDHADLLYELAGQVVKHFRSYLNEGETRRVLRMHNREVASFVHAQMEKHYWEEAGGYDAVVTQGFVDLKPSVYSADGETRSFLEPVEDKANMARYLFNGFQRCLFPVAKFQSDAERRLAIILDRDSKRWFRPSRGQFQLHYRLGSDHPEYQPDFVAEGDDAIYMIESKARNEMESEEVQEKAKAAVNWCRHASEHAKKHGGKEWRYALVPHDGVQENMTLAVLMKRHIQA